MIVKLPSVRKGSELLIVTRNEMGALARIATPLAKNGINIECFSGYEWGGEAAFRFVTSNNRVAGDLLRKEGYSVQENPVVLWQTDNTTGQLMTATIALAEARVNIYSSYASTVASSKQSLAVFGTSNADKTLEILKRL